LTTRDAVLKDIGRTEWDVSCENGTKHSLHLHRLSL
jgi:hypothetical protein